MKKLWLKLADRFDARTPRERFTVFLGLTTLLLGLAYVFGIEPALLRQQKASRMLEDCARQQTLLAEQEIALIAAESADPDSRAKAKITLLQQEINQQRLQINAEQNRLAAPEKMNAILRELIVSQKGLELMSLRSISNEALPSDKASAMATGIYRHGVEISLRGSYSDLIAYVQKIENLPWSVQSGSLSLKTGTYPQSTMTLTLYTLSLERAWLSF